MNATNGDIAQGVLIAAVTALSIALVLWMGKIAGRWFTKALSHSFGEQVVEVMAPDMARLGTRLGTAIDELRVSNTAEHIADQKRLTAVEHRLEAVESALGIRSTDTRTRFTDPKEE